MKLASPYKHWLKEIKNIVADAKSGAALSVNEHLLLMYWQLGQMIVEKQREHSWGDAVIEQLSKDLQKAFPQIKDFSRTNLFNCKKLFLFYSDKKVQPAVGQIKYKRSKALQLITKIPWSHNIVIIEKTNNIGEALFYIAQTIENNRTKKYEEELKSIQ